MTPIAATGEAKGASVLLSDGRGGFSSRAYDTGKWSSDVAAAISTKMASDLAVTNWGSNDVSLLFGKGDGSFTDATNITYEGHPWEHHALYRVLAADLDRDGHLDMVWNDIIAQKCPVRRRPGHSARAILPADRGVRHAEVADLERRWLARPERQHRRQHHLHHLADGKGYYPPQQVRWAAPAHGGSGRYNGDQRIDIAVRISSRRPQPSSSTRRVDSRRSRKVPS
jgi:hypothetical protein